MLPPLSQLAHSIRSGQTSAEAVIEDALSQAENPSGEGSRVFPVLYADQARKQARAIDQARAAGLSLPPLAGVPVSIKDLFDERGVPTLAGSVASQGEALPPDDAPAVALLRKAGAIILGRTSMTEYAFSGLGLNPHYGTPLNPWDRAQRRIPGGSSSGAAVSVSDGMAAMGLGSDTGGSLRIPAALCGLTGFKPTARRINRHGAYPLSTTLDCVGPIARTVRCCALVDAILSEQQPMEFSGRPLLGRRFAVPTTVVLEQMDQHVAESFSAALSQLSHAGAQIDDIPLQELAEIPARSIQGGIAAAEAYALHRQRIASQSHRYDPRVLSRILNGQSISAATYIDCLHARDELCQRVDVATRDYDALLMPTVPIVAPLLQPLIDDDDWYSRCNSLLLRNPSLFNALDRPAISLPCHSEQTAPVGLMVVGKTLADADLLDCAVAIEHALMSSHRQG